MARLADFNRERLAQKQDWLLVQPTGIFPLVGPIFSPGKSACWTCLADRMKWNRQIKAFLDRKEARCVAASPLGRECARAERDRACGDRDRQGRRQRISHRPAPPCRQP